MAKTNLFQKLSERENEFARETMAKFHLSFPYLSSWDINGRSNLNSYVQAAFISLRDKFFKLFILAD